MKNITDVLFEAKMLKDIPRSGYSFLGVGKESVAEHSYMITMIAFVMAKMVPELDALKIISMCLIHDLPEARTGDLNYVQKKYVTADEKKAVREMTQGLPFGTSIEELIDEFNGGDTLESKHAKDADQLSFILELKGLMDVGHEAPKKWIPIVEERLTTDLGKEMARSIINSEWDSWWLKNYVD